MMNREIKFRGKSVQNGNWLYGYYAYLQYLNEPGLNYHVIFIGCEQFEVDGMTVGQYTGLKDKNGKEIYEGDILHHPLNERWFDWLIEIIDGSNKLINIGIDGYRHDPMLLIQQSASARIIIGNIYENPELLK